MLAAAANAAESVSDTVTDIDGNTYTTLQIGQQTWMGENLKVTHDQEGKVIESFCYNMNDTNCDTFGRLYTWHAAMNGSVKDGACGICPKGWHVPSDEEWKILEMEVGMTRADADIENAWRGTNQGWRLSVNGSSGFNFLLGGRRESDGLFTFYGYKNTVAYFWTSTHYYADTAFAWRRCLNNNDSTIGRYNTFPKTWGFSVRCVKNTPVNLESVTKRLIATYDRIDSYEADAEILKKNNCNFKRNTGVYFYCKPESASVRIGESVYTTLDLSGCASVLEGNTILVDPVMSSEPIKRMLQLNPRLEDTLSDTVKLLFTAGETSYEYWVELSRSVIVSIRRTGAETFHANYYYGMYNGIPLLKMMAMNGDTTLQNGGYRFYNIKLNGSLSVRRSRTPNRVVPYAVTIGRGALAVQFNENHNAFRKICIRDLRGKLVFSTVLSPGTDRFTWQGKNNSGSFVTRGVYVIDVGDGAFSRAFPFVWMRK